MTSKTEHTQWGWWLIGIIALIAVTLAISGTIVSTPSCWHQSPIPPPESPIVTVPLEPPAGDIAREYASMEIWWDDPTISQGYAEAYCVGMENIAMFIDWRLKDEAGEIVYGGLVEVGKSAPIEIGSGLFAGPFPFVADLDPEPDVLTVWARPRWDLSAAGCVDAAENPITEVIGTYVPPAGQGTHQDAEGFWYITTIENPVHIYLPMVTK